MRIILLLFLCLLGVSATAQNFTFSNVKYTQTGPFKLKVINHTYAGTVKIPATVIIENKLYDVLEIENEAFRNCYTMTSIELPNSILRIGNRAFESCVGLTSIVLPKSLIEIGSAPFFRCANLKTINIPASVEILDEGAFYGCDSLQNIIVDDNNPKWKSIDGVLYDKQLKKLLLCPSGKTTVSLPETVEFFTSSAFNNCTKLKEVSLPNALAVLPNKIFQNCVSLGKVTISKNVHTIGVDAFQSCSSLKEIKVETENKKYTSVRGVLYNRDTTILIKCPQAVPFIEIPKTVRRLDTKAFAECNELTNLNIPPTILSIGTSCFFECTSLSSVTFQSEQPPFVVDCAFCQSSNSITFFLNEAFFPAYREIGGKYLNGLKWEIIPHLPVRKDVVDEKY
jgi:hypothetical protein